MGEIGDVSVTWRRCMNIREYGWRSAANPGSAYVPD